MEVVNGEVSIKYTASISECIRRAMVLIGSQKVLRLDDLNACVKQLLGNIDIKQLLINSLDGCVEPIIAPPGPLGPPKSTYFRVLNEDCVVKQVVNVILNKSVLGSDH